MGKLVTIATKARFDALREASNISETSLNFILETGLLYTHNIFINGASFGTATSNYIPVKIGGVTKNLSLNGHTHSNYYDNSSDIDIGSNKIKSGTLELLKYSSDTLILGNSSIPTEFFGTLKTTKDGTKYTILDTNNFSIVNKTSTNLTLNNVALFKYGSSSFQLDYVRRYNTVETFNNLAKYTSAGTTNENSKAYGFITLSTDTGTNTYSYAQIRVSIPDNTLEFRTNSDTTWKGTLLGGVYRNITINGTTYSIVTKAGSLPTIIAPTALGTSGQYLTTSDDGKSLTWRTLPTDNNTWRPIAVNGTEKRSSSTGSGNLDIINGTNITVEWTSGNKLKINAVDTWTAFVGASDSVAGTAGYISAPGKGNQGKFFRGDGTWATPTNTWNAANTTLAGYVPRLTTGGGTISTQASEYVLVYVSSGSGTVTPTWKLLPVNAFKNDNTWKAANASQEGYVPKSAANKILRANADGALYWGDDANTTYTFYNLLFQNSGGTTVDTYKPTTSPTKTLKAGANVTISAASNIITIASTNTWNANAVGVAGYVAAPTKEANANMTWQTDAEGVPAWRASNNHSHNYLPLSGGTLNSGSMIVWLDWGQWGAENPTYPKANGGLQWSGTSDTIKLFAEETASDNLRLVLLFGDDDSPRFEIRNKDGNVTAYITTGGAANFTALTVNNTAVSLNGHKHAYTDLTGSSTTANQAIVSNGTANGWTLKTLGSRAFDSASYLPLGGGTMTGVETISATSAISFATRTNSGTRASYYTSGNYIHGGEDHADQDGANVQIGTWYGFGIYPTISGQTRTQGKNSFWHNARTGNTYTWGEFYSYDGSTNRKVLHEGNSSVSLSGSTLSVKINGTTQSLTNTWRGILNNLTSDSTTDSLSAALGKVLNDKFGSYLPLSGGTLTGNLSFSNSGTGFRGINYGTMGDNDQWRIGGAATGSNAGYMEIATADDGAEPIYVRQYTGVFSSLKRTATLLDASGNTSFPGTVSASSFSGTIAWSNVSSKPETATRWPKWSEVTDKPSSFAPSAHDHTRILYIDDRDVVETPTDVAGKNGIEIHFKNKSKSSIPSSGTWTAVVMLDGYSDTSGGYPMELGFSMSDVSESRPLYLRSPKSATEWGGWRTILDSGNSSVSKSGETLTVKINGTSQSLTNSTYTLAGLMGSSAKGSTTLPIYWTGSAFANTSYTLGKSVPSDAVFTDHTYNFGGTTFYSGNSGNAEHNCNNAVKNGHYYYSSNGPATSIGASTSDGALYVQSYSDSWVGQIAQDYRNGRLFVRGKKDGTWQSWIRVAHYNEIPTNNNQLTNGAGYVTSSGVTSVATGTGLTGGTITGTGTISINSTYQTYISHGESAYNSLGNYYPVLNGAGKWSASGGGNNAYCLIAEINTNAGYINYPITFEIGGRGTIISRVTIRFNNQSAADPDCNLFATDEATCFYLYKAAANTWRLYASSPSDSVWGSWYVYRVFGNIAGRVTMKMETVSSLPSGYKSVTYTGNVAYASSAGSVAWSNVSSRPTKLSQFTNDSGFVTSSGVTSITLKAGTGISLDVNNTAITTSGTRTISIKTPSSGAWFSGTAYVGSDGVMEIGRYIDFHPTSASTLDYNIRLDAGTGTTARVFTFPDSAGTLLSSGNSSVSKSGSTLTVKINGTTQSLTNTDTTYSANNGVGLSGTTFYNSGVRATTINGNYLRVNTNGTNADLTIPYATSAGSTKKLASYYDSRPSTANLLLGDGSLRFFEATTSMTEGKPTIGDSSIIHLSWDNNGGWEKQIAVGHGSAPQMMIRTQNNGTWGSWINILDSNNSSVSKSGSTLTVKINGTSQSITDTNTWRGIQDNLTSSTNTTESLSAKQGYLLANGSARDNTKLPLAGGTMTGAITLNNAVYINTKTTGGTSVNTLGMNDKNSLVIGYGIATNSLSTFIEGLNVYIATGSSPSTKMTVASGGNVGIGTTSPEYKLDVSGSIKASESFYVAAGQRIQQAGGTGDFYIGNSGNMGWVRFQDICSMTDTGEKYWSIRTDGRMYAKQHINIGYGLGHQTTNRAEASIISITDLPCDLMLGSNSVKKWSITCRASNESYQLGFWNYTSAAYAAYINGTNFTCAGNMYASNFYTTSDKTKKQNISSFSEHIRKFQLKDTEKWHYGVIAQEVPEMFRDGEEGNMTVNYNSVLSYYVGLLENKVASLEKELSILKQKLK